MNNCKKSSKTELVKKLEKLIEKIRATREKDGENYLEECRYVFEMHEEAKEAGDPDRDLPMLREQLDIGKSTARKMRKMREFWDAQPKEVTENFPKLFSKIGRTKLELLCCLKMEKDADKPSGYKKKKFLRFHDLIIDGEFAKVELINPDQSILAHEYSERDLKRILSSSEVESDDTQAESVEAADSPGADAPSSQESEGLHPKYKTYPELKKAYEALEAEVIEKDKRIAELLAGIGQPERLAANPSTPSAEDQKQTESEIKDAPGLNSDSNEEAQHLDAVSPKDEEEPSAIEIVEEPSEQDCGESELEGPFGFDSVEQPTGELDEHLQVGETGHTTEDDTDDAAEDTQVDDADDAEDVEDVDDADNTAEGDAEPEAEHQDKDEYTQHKGETKVRASSIKEAEKLAAAQREVA